MKTHKWFFKTNWSIWMNTRSVAAEYRLAHWAKVIQERADRGLSIRAYCEESGMHENTYYYWQRKLREAACIQTQTAGMPNMKSLVPQGWTTLSVKEESLHTLGLTVEVGGFCVRVQTDTDPALLTKVFRLLKAI